MKNKTRPAKEAIDIKRHFFKLTSSQEKIELYTFHGFVFKLFHSYRILFFNISDFLIRLSNSLLFE